MLTLASMHVMSDTSDPFYTTLQAGAYAKVKPKGQPCDSAIQDGCTPARLSKKAQLAMAVVITVVGLVVVGLSVWYILLVRKSRTGFMLGKVG